MQTKMQTSFLAGRPGVGRVHGARYPGVGFWERGPGGGQGFRSYSRFFCAYRYVLEETEEQVMLLFRQAVARYGVPDIFYVDRGAPYAGHSLQRAAALIGCRVLHPQAGDPSPRGRVERPMRELEEKLESELRLRKPPTLEEANEYLAAFVTQEYHRRVHSSTGQQFIRLSGRPALSRPFPKLRRDRICMLLRS